VEQVFNLFFLHRLQTCATGGIVLDGPLGITAAP